MDLCQAESRLSSSNLIRIGGQCKDSRLLAFSERSAYQSDNDVNECRARVQRLNDLRDSIKTYLDNHVSSFLSYYHQIFLGDNDADCRKAAVDATEILMESIIRTSKMRAIQEQYGEELKNLSPTQVVSDFDFLLVDAKGKSVSRTIRKLVQSQNGSTHVAGLVNGNSVRSEHWGDLVLKWVTGKYLRYRPSCRATASHVFGLPMQAKYHFPSVRFLANAMNLPSPPRYSIVKNICVVSQVVYAFCLASVTRSITARTMFAVYRAVLVPRIQRIATSVATIPAGDASKSDAFVNKPKIVRLGMSVKITHFVSSRAACSCAEKAEHSVTNIPVLRVRP